MGESNKSLRIRTNVNSDSYVSVSLDQTYDSFEILSLKLKSEDIYKVHSSNYGVIAGRVLANESFGVPNAKISVFIEGDFDNDSELVNSVYPYSSTATKNSDGVRYNLLPDNNVDNCHQVVGTFPNKTYLLDNDVLIEVFDKYYVYTTRTNNSGDYIIMGVPTGNQTIHMDLDLSDCGVLSQRPRDFVYKGYTVEQFENPNQFKTSNDLDSLSQIFSQNQVVNVLPFWGNTDNGDIIGITRADINVAFKFEPTCVFIGSLVADNSSNGISKKCVPTNQMGAMDELTTGEGTIEMIRKTPGGAVEEFQVRGTQLIDGNGIWCYQIPMNLDYMMTDEYGNMVPTDDPDKGIPTRTRVRFRMSMQDNEINTDNFFRAKVLVPHNPQNYSGNTAKHEDYDYEFGTNTKEESFRDLMWNNVYTVKSYIPRFQKSRNIKTERFTGIKHCNIYGNNNPMPYNNIRIRLPLIFTLLCALIKTYIRIVNIINNVLNAIGRFFDFVSNLTLVGKKKDAQIAKALQKIRYLTIADGLCPDLENWYFAPVKENFKTTIGKANHEVNFLKQTLNELKEGGEDNDKNLFDETSTDAINSDDTGDRVCLTIKTDYLISCVEMALAQEYKVINFDFYNDWINGVIYMPRWMRFIRKKRSLLFGLINIKQKIKACVDDTDVFKKSRFYVQQCALSYNNKNGVFSEVVTANGCKSGTKKQKCHKANGRMMYTIFGGKNSKTNGSGGIVHETQTMKQQYVYYLKPCEWRDITGKKTILFANDVVLLGSLNDCNLYGIPQAFKYLTSSSYIMPTNLALTNMDDDSVQYADGSGTMCDGYKPENFSDATINNYKLSATTNSFEGTEKYYSTAADEADKIVYGLNPTDTSSYVFDDTIPITEAAGIAWNYTGPGQGEKSKNVNQSLYYPGGHFLGISCSNSETNIKSCINLQRICEVGSNESQRREEVRSVELVNGGYRFNARCFVPTGLIANDEINSAEFRTMFATMNHRRLLCGDKTDDKTGYPIYDFIYLRNVGFDGALSKQVNSDSKYNMQLDIVDEYNVLSQQHTIELDNDEDTNETGETYTRTIEMSNLDYYKFRLGVENMSLVEQRKRFLIDNGNRCSLPQYENSFYFYFGLRQGSTAFDEFNKQFFSVCENKSILKRTLKLNIIDTPDSCDLTSEIKISGNDAVEGLNIRYEYVDVNGEKIVTTIEPSKIHLNGGIYTVDTFTLPFGTYTFIANDDNMVEVSQTITLGGGAINAIVTTNDFNFKTKGMTPESVSAEAERLNDGYLDIDDVVIDGESVETITVTIVQKNRWDTVESYYGRSVPRVTMGTYVAAHTGVTDNGGLRVYLWKSGCKYDVYIWNSCNKSYLYGTYTINGIDNIDLYLGSYYFPYSTKLYSWEDGWWNNIGNDAGGVDNWLKRYAVFRRTDNDEEYFTNKVFGLDSTNDTNVGSILFGQPEKDTNNGPVLVSGYYCEDDPYEGAIEDNTLISTWYSGSTVRQHFCEMVVNDGVVGSNKVADVTVSAIRNEDDFYYVSLNGGSLVPNTGYIFKTSYGGIIYGVGTGSNTFRYNGEELSVGDVLSLYKTFKYPVMYRPFYAKAYILDWVSLGVDDNMVVDYNKENYQANLNFYNGLTYRGFFDNTMFNGENIVLDSRDSDLAIPEAVVSWYDDNVGEENGIIESYSYSVKEGSPNDLTEEQRNPYGIELITIEQEDAIDSANYLIRKTDAQGTSFTNDIGDTESNKYYIINGMECPLVESGANYTIKNDGNIYIVCRIMEGFPVNPLANVGKLVVAWGTYDDVKFNYVDNEGNVRNYPVGIHRTVAEMAMDLDSEDGGVTGGMLRNAKVEPLKKYIPRTQSLRFREYIDEIEADIESGYAIPIVYNEPVRGGVGTNSFAVAYRKIENGDGGKTVMRMVRIYPDIS